jgi:catechol 2,3-dioxygenase-like lactoylglutathione lyase family enzyme
VYLRSAGEESGDHTGFVVLDQQLTVDPFGRPAKLFQLGVHHVAFWVDEVEPYRRRAIDGGFRCGEPSDGDSVAYGEPSGRGVRTVFLRDPDGTYVQLDQRLD